MLNIMEMLYDGKIDPAEAVTVCNEDSYKDIIKKQTETVGYLKQKLSEEDSRRLDDYTELEFQRSSMYAYANFRYAFKLAVMLMCEVFMDNEVLTD